MRRVLRVATSAMAILALAAVSPGPAHARPSADSIPSAPSTSTDDDLPADWQLTGTGGGKTLVWTSPDLVPMGNARVEFYAGDTLLGRPLAAKDGRSFRLALDDARIDTTEDLRVLAGGRRLDAAASPAPPPRRAAPAQPSTPLPANKVDPGVQGPYRSIKGEYALKSVRLPGFPAPVEMRATVVGPVGAPGKRPLALFLHGRHYTCFDAAGDIDIAWPCRPGTQPVPSHQGYLRSCC
ncbi:hypothetical protein ABCR94_16155 [Streptomyces sp. 21So2-11]|uniref:hypothetical protein n=1 Tax=Streptomyces sp. 21So2-11 TaxID=3144408 RepID=UPI00321A9B81